MEQIHRRFTAEQVKLLLKAYCQGTLDRPTVQETSDIGKARFFALLKQYRHNPEGFCLIYQRAARPRLPSEAEEEIVSELMLERGLIDDPTLPITTYNYSAVRDRLAKHGVIVSLPTMSSGKTTRTRWSRSACISRKVLLTKTRTIS